MLHDVIPRLSKLHIDKSSEMNLNVTARFRDIREIHINSLVISAGLKTKIRLVPFLSRFDKVERVFFGGKGIQIERFAPAIERFEALSSAEVLNKNYTPFIANGCNVAALYDKSASLWAAEVTNVGENTISVRFFGNKTSVHQLPLDRIVRVYDEGWSHSEIVEDVTPTPFEEGDEYSIDKIVCARKIRYGKTGVERIVYRVKYNGGKWEKRLADQYWHLEGSEELDLDLLKRERLIGWLDEVAV